MWAGCHLYVSWKDGFRWRNIPKRHISMAETASSVEEVSRSCWVTSAPSWKWKVGGLELRVWERRRGTREGALERTRLLRRTRRKARDSSRVRKSGTLMRC